jgi:glutaredoxin-related protein
MRLLIVLILSIFSFHTYAQSIEKINFTALDKTKADYFEELNKNELSVFIFYSTECPICIKSLNSIKQIIKDHDLNYYFVYPKEINSKKNIKKFHRMNNLPSNFSKIILDENQVLIKQLDAKVTPQCFLIDSKGNVLYSGKIDDRFEKIGVQKNEVRESYLNDAIISFKKGEEIKVKSTEPVGCFINR